MPNIVLSILGKDSSGTATKSAGGNLEQLQAKRDAASAALVKASRQEADAAGRARVAEAQLAEARTKYAADSSQVIAAEERLETAHRRVAAAGDTALASAARLEGAQRRLATAEASAASAAENASTRTRSAFAGIGEAATSMASRAGSSLGDLAGKTASLAAGIAKQAAGVAIGFAVYDVGARAANAAFEVGKSAVIDFNSQLENATIGFTTMLGSGKKATDFLNGLQAFARNTPFQFSDLTQYAQQMLAYGIKAKEVLPTLTALGDAAAGSGRMDMLPNTVLAFEQMAARGRVDLQDLNQMTQGGVPALQILSNAYGVTTGEMLKMVSTGKLMSSDALPKLRKGIEDGTKTTSAFGGMMDKQSRTFLGAMSNISDGLNQSLGTAFRPFFKVLEQGAVSVSKFAGSKAFQKWASDTSNALGKVLNGKTLGMIGDFFSSLTGAKSGKSSEKFMTSLRKGIADIGPAMSKILPDLVDFGKTVLPGIIDAATGIIDKLPTLLKWWERAAAGMKKAGPTIKDIIGFLSDLSGTLFDVSANIGNFAADAVKNFLQFKKDAQKVITDFGVWMVSAGANVVQGFIDGITSKADLVGHAIDGIAKIAQSVFHNGPLKFGSPSKLFAQYGKWVSEGLAKGIKDGSAADVADAMSTLSDKVKDGYTGLSAEVRKARETVSGGDAKLDKLDDAAARLGRSKSAAEARLADAKTNRQKQAAEDALANIEDQQRANQKARKAARDDIADAKDVLRADKSAAARKKAEGNALAQIAATNKQLAGLAAARDILTEQLKTAQDNLDTAKSTRDDYSSSTAASVYGLGNISSAFGSARDARDQAANDLPDLQQQLADLDRGAQDFGTTRSSLQQQLRDTDVADTITGLNQNLRDLDQQVADYQQNRAALTAKIASTTASSQQSPVQALLTNLQKQGSDATEFKSDLAQLRTMGLDDGSYKQLVDDYANGNGLDTARGLIAAGAGQVQAVVSLQAQLKSASDSLGLSTSTSLYQAGVDSAQGFVDGLNSQIGALTTTMTGLADSMVTAIKKQLGIKSPSTVFKAQGVFVTQGLVQGLISGKGDVASTVAGLVPTRVGVPNVAGGATSGRARAGVHVENLNFGGGATVPDMISALDWLGRVGV